MFKSGLFLLAACMLIGACSKKGTTRSSIAPHDHNHDEKKTEAPVEPKNTTATILEGTWERECVDFDSDDPGFEEGKNKFSFISIVTVKGDALKYEEEVFGGYGCDAEEFIAVEFTKSYNFKIASIEDGVMTHSVDALKADGSLEFTWVLRMKNDSEFLSSAVEFLDTRDVDYYTGSYKKVK